MEENPGAPGLLTGRPRKTILSSAEHGSAATHPLRRRWDRLRIKLVALFVSVGFVLVIAEIGFPMVLPVTDIPFHFWDPLIGSRYAPDQSGRHIRNSEVDAPYHFNAQGWNHPDDYDTTKPPGTRRVCVVGDSYVEAIQVPHESTFFALAERRMSRPDRAVQWYTFGNSGFGTAHESLLIRSYVLDHRPDLVVMLFVPNDVADCSPYLADQEDHMATMHLDDAGELVLQLPRRYHPSPAKRLLARSALVRYFTLQTGLIKRHRRAINHEVREAFRESMTVAADADGTSTDLALLDAQRRSWELIEKILVETQQECARRGVPFALAYRGHKRRIEAVANGGTHVDPPRERDPYCLGKRSGLMGEEILGTIAERHGIPYLDLTEGLIAGAEKAGQPVHIPGDGHFSAAGHRAVADAMIPWVEVLLNEGEYVADRGAPVSVSLLE